MAVAILAVASSVIAQAASGAPAQKPFSLTLSGPQGSLKVGMPVSMKLTLTNISGQDLLIMSSRTAWGLEFHYTFSVRDAQGNVPARRPMPPLAVVKPDATASGKFELILPRSGDFGMSLKPGASDHEQFDLGESFDLTKPGKYTVQLKRKDVKTGVEVESNTVTVTVAK